MSTRSSKRLAAAAEQPLALTAVVKVKAEKKATKVKAKAVIQVVKANLKAVGVRNTKVKLVKNNASPKLNSHSHQHSFFAYQFLLYSKFFCRLS